MRTCPAATTTGCTAGGGTCEGDQCRGRSQPSTVRTQSDVDGDSTRSAGRPSMRHETNPALASSSKIPRIERMGGVALARGTPQAQFREKWERERRVCGGDGGGQAARLASSARLMPLVNPPVEARENAEKTAEDSGRGSERTFSMWPKGDVEKRRLLICVNTTTCRILTARSRRRVSPGMGPATRATTARRKSFPQPIHRTSRRSLRWRNRLPFSRRCPPSFSKK